MKVVMVSKALVVGEYQRKLDALATEQDLDLTCIVPPWWQEPGGRRIALERQGGEGYRLLVEPIRFNGSFHLFYFPTLARRLRELQPDLVHVDEEPYNLATFLATRHSLEVGATALFFTWQNLLRRYPPPWRWTERYVLARSAGAIAGNLEAQQVLRAKQYRGPIACIPQFGVDEQRFSPAVADPPPPFHVGFVGRLVEEKGILDLLDGLARLGGGWRASLIGSGPLRSVVAQRVQDEPLKGRVSLLEGVPSSEIPEHLRGLHVLVLPSVARPNWKEQFGRALVEAMSCGVPVVGTRSGEIPNVIGDAGLLVAERDPYGLSQALDRIRAEPDLRRCLGQAGRQRVLERYTHARIAEQTAQLYRSLGSARRSAPTP